MIEVTSIDAGGRIKKCSAAVFQGPTLAGCALVAVFEQITVDEVWDTSVVVVERPQQDGRSRAVPPAILMDLAWQAALVVGGFAARGAEIVEYYPDDWKAGARADGKHVSGLPKAIHHANMIETGGLTADELQAIAAGGACGGVSGDAIASEVFAARKKGALCRWRPHKNGHYSEKSRTPDVLDAIGIGLYHIGRIDKDGKRK